MISLSDFPTELLMEIIKYFPAWYDSGVDARIHGVRSLSFGHYALRALSQTCKTLRRIFIPILWAHVNACRRGVERRMRNIRKMPHVMPYIQSLSVRLQECTMENWQPIAQFLLVLQLLPNLRSLTILSLPSDMIPVLMKSCENMVFPSVVWLALPGNMASILHFFPNVRTLTGINSPSNLLVAAKDSCESIHTFNDLWFRGGARKSV
ncbi:hypothetical protein C8R44DRAFT_301236 [Mycena epipterygia]|nr:hypothetical protein C8R44DRAFT_301236 [Mycena epipterygia]